MNTLAAIIINYNSSEYTINCIESIWEKTSESLNYEIIVVDNNSNIENLKVLELFLNKKNNDSIKLIKSKIKIKAHSAH